MQTPIPTPPKFVGRSTVRSGPIVRSNPVSSNSSLNPNPPVYGVVFTMSEPASPSDFTVQELLGATLENVDQNPDLNEPGKDQYFTILGGYFCKRDKKKGEVEISHIFGIAADSSKGFNLTPGNHSIVDEWERKDLYQNRRKTVLDERSFGKDGWTFIVNYKPNRHMYPLGCAPINLSRSCPVITNLNVVEGKLEKFEQVVSASVSTSGGHVDKYVWDWGDGNTEETQTPTASHSYTRSENAPSSYTIKVTAHGTGSCEDSKTHTYNAPPPPCPEVKFSSLNVTNLDGQTARVSVTLKVTGPMPDEFKWVWKDGTETVTVKPEATHEYPRSKDGPTQYDIKAVGKGPGECIDRAHCVATIPPAACPKILKLEKISETLTETHLTVKVKAVIEDPNNPPASLTWNWGDGSTPEKSTSLEREHAYERPVGEGQSYFANVEIDGECPNPEDIYVSNVPGRCPKLDGLTVEKGELTETTQEVKATVNIIGANSGSPVPDSFIWNWGDGTPPESTTTATHTHLYQRPAGNANDYKITVTTSGPGDCSGAAEGETVIPGVCPVIDELVAEVISVEGDQATVKFLARISGPTPDSIVWDFGDGEGFREHPELVATHRYTLPYNGELKITAVLKTSGPESCGSEASVELSIPGPPCPVFQGLTYEIGAVEGGTIEYFFEVSPGSPAPSTYTWEFGDGSEPQTTESHRIRHAFPFTYGVSNAYVVKVTGNGPGDCRPWISIDLPIDPPCPTYGELEVSGELSEDGKNYTVTVNLPIETPVGAEEYTWDWGDGNAPEKTSTPTASHTYSCSLGYNQTYQISVTADGPGACQKVKTTIVIVPKCCPLITDIKVSGNEKVGDQYHFTFEVELSEGKGDEYRWGFGDGSPIVTTTEPTVKHIYNCLAVGQEETYPVYVTVIGPGECRAEGQTSVLVGGCDDVCPVVHRINVAVENNEAGDRTYVFVPAFGNGVPDKSIWDFGDGSDKVETNEPDIEHTFPASKTEKEYKVVLTTEGPSDCKIPESVVYVKVPPVDVEEPKCPEITGIKVVWVRNTSDSETQVCVQAEYTGPKPEEFTWSWEGGSAPKTTKVHETIITFKRPPQDAECSINLRTSGPGDCKGEAVIKVKIEAAVTGSFFCKYWKLIVAFLGCLAIGAAIICIAAEILDQGEQSWSNGILLYTGLTIFAFGAVLFWWITQGKSKSCPPTRCDWYALGWSMMLAALTVVFFMINCFPNWIPWAAVFFVLLGVDAYLWFTRCAPKSRAQVFFTYFFIAIIAAVINMFLIAGPALTCC